MKVYLDYNIWQEMLNNEETQKFFILKKEQGWRYYLSVAHLDELCHAHQNETPQYTGFAEKLKLLMFEHSESGLFIPDDNGIVYHSSDNERNQRMDIIGNYYSSQGIVSNLAKGRFKNFKDDGVENISGIEGVNADELYTKIWEHPRIAAKIENYNNCTSKFEKVTKDQAYRFMADELVDFYKPLVKIDEVAYKYIIAMTEKIRPNMFPNIRNDFYKIESVIEYLFFVLTSCGYKMDTKEHTFISSYYDTKHSILSVECDIFITKDKKLKEKFKAIAYYLGIPIKIQLWNNGQLII